ncbi:MAG: hypothetical protein RLZZ528_515 [Pseudomonadota bacterium]|jgi:CheY-like chemotaxis protein
MNQPDRPEQVRFDAEGSPAQHRLVAMDAAELAQLGHDLRSALADIIGGLRLIDQTDLGADTQRQLERIRSSGEVLARLLEESLTAMLGEEICADGPTPTIQMARFLYDLEVRWSGRAAERGMALDIQVAENVPSVIAVDRIALERILSNTLSNAIKYSDGGNVTMFVGLGADNALAFSVQDSGPGFSSAALDRLFEYEGRPEGTSKPGHGLGMHISHGMAKRIGGTIAVENTLQGAIVTLSLPETCWRHEGPLTAGPLPDLSAVKILLAEDSLTNQLLIGQMLADMGAEVEIASDGLEALHWLDRETFDIVLVDIDLPRMSGLDVIRAMRAREHMHAQTPVVAVTAYTLREKREEIYKAGADAVLAKPVAGIEALGLAVHAALDRYHGRARPESGSAPSSAVNAATFDNLLRIAGESGVPELLFRLTTDLERTATALRAGLESGDQTAIRAETHVLIALAGAVGAEQLQKMSEALNASAHRRTDTMRDTLGHETLAQVGQLVSYVRSRAAQAGTVLE